MSDLTRRFDLSDMKEWETREILTEVYNSLQQKGYNPINQILSQPLRMRPNCKLSVTFSVLYNVLLFRRTFFVSFSPLFSSQWNPFEEVSLTRRQQCVTIWLQLTGKEVYRIG